MLTAINKLLNYIFRKMWNGVFFSIASSDIELEVYSKWLKIIIKIIEEKNAFSTLISTFYFIEQEFFKV